MKNKIDIREDLDRKFVFYHSNEYSIYIICTKYIHFLFNNDLVKILRNKKIANNI